MTEDLKVALGEALNKFIEVNQFSQNEFCELYNINGLYVGNIRKGKFTIPSAGRDIEIADKYFNMIADAIDYDLQKKYWKIKNTAQFTQAVSKLSVALAFGEISVIIGETGSGKSFAVAAMKRKFPKNVYAISVRYSEKASDMLVALIEATGHKPEKYGRMRQLKRILKQKQQEGDVQILLDEGEYAKRSHLILIKELYDDLKNVCSIGLLGTKQLLDKIEGMVKRDMQGMPQFYRRIKFRITMLNPIDRQFKDFLNGKYEPELEHWLKRNCANYGELHDVLVPALREADRLGRKSIDLDFVKMVLGID